MVVMGAKWLPWHTTGRTLNPKSISCKATETLIRPSGIEIIVIHVTKPCVQTAGGLRLEKETGFRKSTFTHLKDLNTEQWFIRTGWIVLTGTTSSSLVIYVWF